MRLLWRPVLFAHFNWHGHRTKANEKEKANEEGKKVHHLRHQAERFQL